MIKEKCVKINFVARSVRIPFLCKSKYGSSFIDRSPREPRLRIIPGFRALLLRFSLRIIALSERCFTTRNGQLKGVLIPRS